MTTNKPKFRYWKVRKDYAFGQGRENHAATAVVVADSDWEAIMAAHSKQVKWHTIDRWDTAIEAYMTYIALGEVNRDAYDENLEYISISKKLGI